MVLLRYNVTAVLAASFLLRSTLATRLLDKLRVLGPGARDLVKKSTPAAPRFVIYNDAWVNSLPAAADLKGYNVYALSFWMTNGATDMALTWQELTDSERNSYLQEYDAAGISLIVSAFGATDAPTSGGTDPVAIANSLASWVLQYGLHGVDIDYEDFNAFYNKEGTAEPWLITLTQQLRKHLPQEKYSLSHAPISPLFSPNTWSGGGYLQVHQAVGSLIDWYNVQFYNQGTTEFTTCNGLLIASSAESPESALFQIVANGVHPDMLVIGKPGTTGDADNGYMTTLILASCVAQAASSGWNAGVMVWEYPHVGTSWINAIRSSWPV
ncbi:glycoside hydrolase family 18 protein [Boletus edulis]|uniref:Glycoside hydrolase family 18 protein n=1 Tax=Boletus edulis BED1 TaxID=1328754 RepID=A0AAD4BGY9_BOLED|nr:glycoside hydrolase family 18 protein [Boletus edulis]KAF8428423.1 glycoside hydrolase family 18 protein [Boletus edulis BED1]